MIEILKPIKAAENVSLLVNLHARHRAQLQTKCVKTIIANNYGPEKGPFSYYRFCYQSYP